MHIDLSDQVILVTGSSRGIGASIARHLSDSGATVALHGYRNVERAQFMAKTLEGKATAFSADLADPDACIDLVDRVLNHYGKIDCLVNNAGLALSSPLDDSATTFTEKWDRTLDVNLRAAALLSRAAIQSFKNRGNGGRLITIASRAAFRGDTSAYLAYAASKGGMVALTRSIARAYGKDGITAFVIAPGFTRTDMAQSFIDTYGEAHAAKDLALTRLTEPDDIAPMVVLLASGMADHATGTTIDFNAGSYVH